MRIFKTKRSEEAPPSGQSRKDVVIGTCRLCGRYPRLLLRSTRSCVIEVKDRHDNPVLVPSRYCLHHPDKNAPVTNKTKTSDRAKAWLKEAIAR